MISQTEYPVDFGTKQIKVAPFDALNSRQPSIIPKTNEIDPTPGIGSMIISLQNLNPIPSKPMKLKVEARYETLKKEKTNESP